MAVELGSVSHDIYDAAAKMLENKRIQTQLQIAREQIKQQQRSQAMGMAGQALSALNQNQQNKQAQDHQAQQRERDRQAQAQNNRIRGMNLLRQAMNKRIEDWNKKVASLREKGFEFDPADMQQMIAMEKKFTDEMKTLSPEQQLQAEQDFHEQFTRFMPKVQRFPDPQSWKFTDPATKQTYPFNPVTKVVDWLHPLGVTVDDAERIRKNDEDHKLKMMDQKRKNLEEARAIFKDEYESGSTYNEAADAALATTGIDPKGGIRKSPGDPGFTHTNFKEVTAQLNQQKYYDSVMDKVMERAGQNYDRTTDKASTEGRQKAMTDAWEKSPYFKSYQTWKSKQEVPSAQQASSETQAPPENQLPQEVHEAMQYLQNIKTFMERAAAAGKGDKPFDSAATANTVQAEIRRATDVVESYQRSRGIVPKQTAPQAVAPQQPAQPTAVQQPQPAAAQQPQAPQAAPADTGERKGPFKGRIINDSRTSSLGGGGTGLLAMGINPLQAIYDGVKSAQPEKQAAPFGATDASQQDAGGDPAFGFRTKMESWLDRNPAPGASPYSTGKMDARYRDWATQRMAVENSQADAFGLPRDQARQVSNRIDGYRDGSKSGERSRASEIASALGMSNQPSYPAEGFSKSTLREMQAKADKIVPEKTPVAPQDQWSSDARRNASAESRKQTTATEDRIDNAYNNADRLHKDESGQWLRSVKGSGTGPDGEAGASPWDYTTGRYEKVPQSYVDKLKSSGKDGIRYSEDADGNLVPEQPYGYEQRLAENQKYNDQSKVIFGDRKLFPDTPNGPAAYSFEAQADNEYAKQQSDRNLVTAYLASPNSEMPKGQDKDSALSTSAEANQQITEAANNGLMPFDLKWNYDKTPEWAEKLPAFEWRNKDGKIERQSGFKGGADKLIDEVSKSMEVGKYDPATVAAENAAKEQQNAEPPATPNPLPKELTSEHINALRPENQEAYLREPVAPTRKEFDAQMREQYGDPIGGGNYDADYQAMIDARNAVRSSMPQSVDDAAPGNLFIDKDGTLKRNDNGKPSPVKPNDPLPPGYGQRVTLPQPQQLPQVANPQGQPAPDPRAQQAARQADILRRGAAVRKEMINDPRWKPLIDNKGNFRPLPGEMQRPAPVQQKPQQLGDPMSQRLQTQEFFPPTASSFNQFPQQQQAQLPSYDNSLASLGFSSDYMPQPNIDPVRYDINGMNDYYNAPLQQSAYEQLDFQNYQQPMQYQNFQQQYPAFDSPMFDVPLYNSYPSEGYYPAGDYSTSSYYGNYA